jgi:hypothetical protein
VLYAIIGLVVLISITAALYCALQKSDLETQISALQKTIEEQEASHAFELEGLRSELSKLEKLRHIPGIIEKSKKTEQEIAAKLEQAQKEADETVLIAHKEAERMKRRMEARAEEAQLEAYEAIRAATQEANDLKQRILGEAESDAAKAREARRIAEWQANNVVEEAQKKAKEIASQARKEAKEKTQKVDDTLIRATAYALDIREKAEARAREIAGAAYEALKRHEFYESAAKAMQNVISGYEGTYLVPASHILDELADEYGFHQAGERLKIARERARIMEKNGTAATCNYPEGWKRDYAINFVLSAFNGKVDSILARLKPANQGKLIQEIKDVYALANHNGEVFKNARIHEEYLDARLEELKWAVAVQRLKEKEREEQRAIREQIREEEKARKEYERAIKQAEREEANLSKAIEQARLEYAAANAERPSEIRGEAPGPRGEAPGGRGEESAGDLHGPADEVRARLCDLQHRLVRGGRLQDRPDPEAGAARPRPGAGRRQRPLRVRRPRHDLFRGRPRARDGPAPPIRAEPGQQGEPPQGILPVETAGHPRRDRRDETRSQMDDGRRGQGLPRDPGDGAPVGGRSGVPEALGGVGGRLRVAPAVRRGRG